MIVNPGLPCLVLAKSRSDRRPHERSTRTALSRSQQAGSAFSLLPPRTRLKTGMGRLESRVEAEGFEGDKLRCGRPVRPRGPRRASEFRAARNGAVILAQWRVRARNSTPVRPRVDAAVEHGRGQTMDGASIRREYRFQAEQREKRPNPQQTKIIAAHPSMSCRVKQCVGGYRRWLPCSAMLALAVEQG